MAKSRRLRLVDLRAAYKILGECCEMGMEPSLWFPHLLDGARRLIGATVVTGGQVKGWASGRPQGLMILDHGWDDDLGHQIFHQWLAEGDLQSDFFYARICEMRRPILTRRRRQLVSDAEWYRSNFYNNYVRFGRTDDYLMSCYTLPDGDLVQSIALHRANGDAPFDERANRLIHWLHHEIGPLLDRQLLTARRPSERGLPPRQKQTLRCLLKGLSEKEVASQLGLSKETIHDYVKAIYRHFGVSSRAELMARWIRLRE
jgi:DNA-binding CsgD family transcriptional regulator